MILTKRQKADIVFRSKYEDGQEHDRIHLAIDLELIPMKESTLQATINSWKRLGRIIFSNDGEWFTVQDTIYRLTHKDQTSLDVGLPEKVMV